MLTAATIIDRAAQQAHARGMGAQGLDYLNSILSDLCETYDFALTRDVFSFTFNPGLQSNFGSGPYTLPLDYLRASGSSGSEGAQRSFIWYLNGVPYPMVPVDLAEFDIQVQQAGLQSYPWLWATDMANYSRYSSSRYVASTTAGTNTASLNITTATDISASLQVGFGIAGEGIVPGTLVAGVSGTTITLDTLPAATLTAASVFFGICPVGYTYPPPSGAYAVQFRYQRMMPPITDLSKVPWFPNEEFLITKLSARLMDISDDSRAEVLMLRAQTILRRYLEEKDDDRTRSKTVTLDRRVFGPSMRTLPNTKTIGW